jgi:hypothetical protein
MFFLQILCLSKQKGDLAGLNGKERLLDGAASLFVLQR